VQTNTDQPDKRALQAAGHMEGVGENGVSYDGLAIVEKVLQTPEVR
jgi:hypothetical protein